MVLLQVHDTLVHLYIRNKSHLRRLLAHSSFCIFSDELVKQAIRWTYFLTPLFGENIGAGDKLEEKLFWTKED